MKMKSYFLFAAIWGAILLSPAHAQVGRISGTVTDQDGKPIKDVQISIEGLEVKRNYTTKTNKEGKYIHAGVSLQGTYRVVAKKEGYAGDWAQGVKPTFGGGEGAPVDFVLKPGDHTRPLGYELTDEQKAELIRQNEEAKKRQESMAAVQEAFNQGLQAFNSGAYQTAADSFKQALEKDPKQPAVWAYLGESYDKLKNYPEAVAAYEKAIALSPNDAGLYQNLGNIHASQGDTEKAKVYYEKSAQLSAALDPKAAATTYYNMGVTYINSGQSEQAVEALRKAVAADDAHAEAHYQLGITLIGVNDLPGAVKHLKRYLELEPNGANAETAKALVEQLAQ